MPKKVGMSLSDVKSSGLEFGHDIKLFFFCVWRYKWRRNSFPLSAGFRRDTVFTHVIVSVLIQESEETHSHPLISAFVQMQAKYTSPFSKREIRKFNV